MISSPVRVLAYSAASRRVGVPHDSQTGQGQIAPWAYAVALAWWASSWNLRNSVLMSWSPLEPIWLGSAAVALSFVHRCGRPLRLDTTAAGLVVLLTIGFLPGALLSSGHGGDRAKVPSMIFVLLPVLCVAMVLLDTRAAAWRWAWAQAIVGGAVAVAAVEFNDPARILQPGRFSLALVDTISAGRFVGAAAVVLLVHGLVSRRHRWWALALGVGCAMVVVHIGSRGPLIAVLVAVVVVVLVGRCFAGRRTWPVLIGVGAVAAAYVYARVAGGSGGARIVASVQSGLDDGIRAHLLRDAFHLGLTAPQGIGWGDFALRSQTGAQIANGQGVAYAHNVLAETWSEGGVVALVVFVSFATVALVALQRRSRDPRVSAGLALAVYWLVNAQVSGDIIGNRFMWIALACGVASCGRETRAVGSSRTGSRRLSRPDSDI